MKRFKLPLLLAFAWLSYAAHAIENCPDGKPADGINRAGNAKNCLVALASIAAENPNLDSMVVFLHGDNSGRIQLGNFRSRLRFDESLKTTTIFLARPGYRTDTGDSDGFNAMADDDYTAGNVDIVAQALHNLRQVHAKKIILVGHSGGSAMTALVANRYPQAADAYVVVACPCFVDEWRQWRNASTGRSGHWPKSLSPHKETENIPKNALIHLLVGTSDANTKPVFSENYIALLQKQGTAAKLSFAQGADHSSVLRAPELASVIEQTIQQLRSR